MAILLAQSWSSGLTARLSVTMGLHLGQINLNYQGRLGAGVGNRHVKAGAGAGVNGGGVVGVGVGVARPVLDKLGRLHLSRWVSTCMEPSIGERGFI